MAIPLLQAYRVGRYIVARRLRGERRYPLVLMLEPLFQCNLACYGCGKIDYPKEVLQRRMSVADELHAVDECGAPVNSIAGGSPITKCRRSSPASWPARSSICVPPRALWVITSTLPRLALPDPVQIWTATARGRRYARKDL